MKAKRYLSLDRGNKLTIKTEMIITCLISTLVRVISLYVSSFTRTSRPLQANSNYSAKASSDWTTPLVELYWFTY